VSESGSEDCLSSDFSESEIEACTESEYEDEPLIHAIILPNYKEDMDTLKETLEVMASHQFARSSYEVRAMKPKLGCC
jgi:antirestriction protein